MIKFLGLVLGIVVWTIGLLVIAPLSEIGGYATELFGAILVGFFLTQLFVNKKR